MLSPLGCTVAGRKGSVIRAYTQAYTRARERKREEEGVEERRRGGADSLTSVGHAVSVIAGVHMARADVGGLWEKEGLEESEIGGRAQTGCSVRRNRWGDEFVSPKVGREEGGEGGEGGSEEECRLGGWVVETRP